MIKDIDDTGFNVDPFGEALESKDAILVSDNDGKVLMKNSVFERIWDFPEKISNARDLRKLIEFASKLTHQPDEFVSIGRDILKNKNQVMRTEIFLNKGLILDMHTFPMIGADSRIHGRIWYLRDITEQKRVEDMRNLQHLMMENLWEGVLMTEAKGSTIVYTNNRFNSIFGYGPGELIGKHISILNAHANLTPTEKAEEINKKLEEAGRWLGIIKNVKKNGESFWSEVKISKVDHSQYGTVWVSLQKDITFRMELENELQSYSERFQTFFEKGIAPMLIITVDGGVLMANSEACNLFGRTEQELISIGREKMVNLADSRWAKLNKQRIRTGKFRGEFSVVHKDGHLIEVEGSSVTMFDHNGIEHTHVILRDRTKYLKKAKKLAESQALYKTLFESFEEPVVIWDPKNWKVVKANKVALKRLQLSGLKEMRAKGGPDRFSPGDQEDGQDARKMVETMGDEAIKKGKVEFQWQHKTKEGVQYPVKVILTKVKVGEKIYLQANIKRAPSQIKSS